MLHFTFTERDSQQHYINRIADFRANFILRAFSIRKIRILFQLYVTSVRPILEYCPIVWSPSSRGIIESIEKVQVKITEKIPRKNALISYTDRLLNLGGCTIEMRRKLSDYEFVKKMSRGLLN